MVDSITGGCFCGAVRYSAAVEPLGSMVCHCNTCRRVVGAPVVAWITFPKVKFKFTSGQPRQLQSSPNVLREFCGACGTPLTYRSQRFPNEVDVATCTLDNPNAFPPTHHSWLSHDLSWVRFGDGLPTYAKSRHSESQ